MKRYFKKQLKLIASTTAALFLLASVASSSAIAGSRPIGGPFPKGFIEAVLFGTLTFLFLDGLFYKKEPKGYVVTQAPIGATVSVLPPDSQIVNIDGTLYYTYSGIYYQQIAEGYLVVKQPNTQLIKVIEERSQLRVTVDSLNVRSSPDKDGTIIQQVKLGERLTLKQEKSAWSLVGLPDRSSGWVMTQYTTSTADEPKG